MKYLNKEFEEIEYQSRAEIEKANKLLEYMNADIFKTTKY